MVFPVVVVAEVLYTGGVLMYLQEIHILLLLVLVEVVGPGQEIIMLLMEENHLFH